MMSNYGVFIGLTVIGFGFVAWMTGKAVATTWRNPCQVVAYGIGLTLFDRFLGWSLFGLAPLSVSGFLIDFMVITTIGLFSWRLMKAHMMVRQYPWIYARSGLFGWRTL